MTMNLPKFQTAACVDEPGPQARVYERHDVEIPEPADGEVLVKLEFTGVW